jgi:hypothetical protein
MNTVKVLTAPIWFPIWLIWTIVAVVGRTFWFVITLSIKLTILLLAVFGLLVWLTW